MADSAAEPVIVWTLSADDGIGCEWHITQPLDIEDCPNPAVWRAEVAGVNGEWDICADHLAVAVLDLVTPAL